MRIRVPETGEGWVLWLSLAFLLTLVLLGGVTGLLGNPGGFRLALAGLAGSIMAVLMWGGIKLLRRWYER